MNKFTIKIMTNYSSLNHILSFERSLFFFFIFTLILMLSFSLSLLKINSNFSISSYDIKKITAENNLAKTKTQLIAQQIEQLNERIIYQNKNILSLQTMTSSRELLEKNFALNEEFQKVSLEKTLLGSRLLKYQIKIGNRQLYEYFIDLDNKNKEERLINEQRISDIHNNIQEILNSGLFFKEIETVHIAEDEYIGLIDNLIVFYISKQDAVHYQTSAEDLAQKYKKILISELKIAADNYQANRNPLMGKITLLRRNPGIKELSQDINRKMKFIAENINKNQGILTDVYSASLALSSKYAKTPSISPLKYTFITSPYGYRIHPITKKHMLHTGIDFGAYIGTKIKSTADGRVTYVGWLNGYGKTIKIAHGDGLSTLYAHCSNLYVKRGQYIKKDQLIALSGNSGLVAGPHLHYEIRKFDKPIDPTTYLSRDILTAKKNWDEENF